MGQKTNLTPVGRARSRPDQPDVLLLQTLALAREKRGSAGGAGVPASAPGFGPSRPRWLLLAVTRFCFSRRCLSLTQPPCDAPRRPRTAGRVGADEPPKPRSEPRFSFSLHSKPKEPVFSAGKSGLIFVRRPSLSSSDLEARMRSSRFGGQPWTHTAFCTQGCPSACPRGCSGHREAAHGTVIKTKPFTGPRSN